MSRKYLIVTADDYGMSEAVNKAIEDGFEAGCISTTNVMANMPFAEGATLLKKRYPWATVGLHWNLSTGKAVLPLREIDTIVDSKGNFYSPQEFKKRYKYGKVDKSQIKKELTAQYERFVTIAGQPDYWNTHVNIHVNTMLFDFFCNVSAELNIKAMRCHKRIRIESPNPDNIALMRRLAEPLKKIVLYMWYRKLKTQGIKMPDGLLVFASRAEKYKLTEIIGNIRWGKNSCAELVIHPAAGIDSRYFGGLTEERIKEYEVFRSKKIATELSKHGVKIAGFEVV
jgi:predicted glycoside hydrolase/deacetylase ChbG (UPF0249 family)